MIVGGNAWSINANYTFGKMHLAADPNSSIDLVLEKYGNGFQIRYVNGDLNDPGVYVLDQDVNIRDIKYLSIVDVSGKLLHHTSNVIANQKGSINLKDLLPTAGVYFVKVDYTHNKTKRNLSQTLKVVYQN